MCRKATGHLEKDEQTTAALALHRTFLRVPGARVKEH